MSETDIYIWLYRIYDDNVKHAVTSLENQHVESDEEIHQISLDLAKWLSEKYSFEEYVSEIPSEILGILEEVKNMA